MLDVRSGTGFEGEMAAATKDQSGNAARMARALQAGPLFGVVRAPGDKSISQRALIFGALSAGKTTISGLLEGEDVLRTAAALRALGADIEREGGIWRITGGAWRSPEKALFFGNSGTGARLVMGAVAGAGVAASFDGDKSLRSRPMGRVLEPLRMMGVKAEDSGGRLPVRIGGNDGLTAINVKLATPSAQVKSAILLAALRAEGVTRIHEPILCRDHTERMLAAFGAKLKTEGDGAEGRFIEIQGGGQLQACEVTAPGDPSSAAFLIAATVVTPDSEIVVENVLVNPLRAGFYQTLREMGADITFENQRAQNGEPVADIRARHSVLSGVEVPAARAPSMIDEYPILSIVASFANGETIMRGLDELRVKESDRLASVEAGLIACGVDVASGEDWLRIRGGASAPKGGARVKTHHDHRIAMSFLVMGGASGKPVEIDDCATIATSFPGFLQTMTTLGAAIET